MRRALVVGTSLFSACLLFSGTAMAQGIESECDAVPDNIVANCGFETGDFRPEWTAEFGSVVGRAAHSGNFGMALDSQDPRDEACVSQTLATVPGQTYDLSYWSQTEGDGEFTALWDGLIIDWAWTGTPWHQRAWLVCGHGTDTLTFAPSPSVSSTTSTNNSTTSSSHLGQQRPPDQPVGIASRGRNHA